MPDQSPIPPADRATQIPPATGAIQRGLVWLFGPSYRTTIASIGTGISGTAAALVAIWPQLANGPITARKAVFVALSVLAGGGMIKLGTAAKDKSVTGVEK